MIERIANQSVPIRLGYAGENEVLRVGFDLSSLKSLFPGGHPLLVVKRPADQDAYPVSLEIADDFGWWTVSNVDTEQAGYGSCQIHWYIGNQLAKSEQYLFFVNKALASGSTKPPEAAEQWYDNFIKTIGSMESLKTTDKTSIIAAINELFDLIQNQNRDMPVASDTQIGGIMASDTITVDKDGKAHASVSPMYATDAEVTEMLNEVFGA